MARYTIELLHPNSPAQPDVPGKRITVNLPEPPENLKDWDELLKWFRDNPQVPFAFHTTILALSRTFTNFPQPR